MRALLDSGFWEWLTIGSVGIGLVAALVFVVRFQMEVGWSWWSSPFGRFLMVRKILLACLFVLVLLNRTLEGWPLRNMVTALLMLAFALQTFVPYRLLVKVQRDHDTSRTFDDMGERQP
jgi:predicted ferric reductase